MMSIPVVSPSPVVTCILGGTGRGWPVFKLLGRALRSRLTSALLMGCPVYSILVSGFCKLYIVGDNAQGGIASSIGSGNLPTRATLSSSVMGPLVARSVQMALAWSRVIRHSSSSAAKTLVGELA